MKKKLLSLIVPVYFEEECIEQFIKETVCVMRENEIDYEIVFIDDGSSDQTVELISLHANHNSNIKLIQFSYNHGKQLAVSAGISYAKGDYLLYMDPDLQDPPLEIPRFLAEIEKGYDIVFGIREEKCDSYLNKIFSRFFWWTLARFTGLNIPKGLAVMRIFNRKFADQFLLYREQNRFIEGIFIHIGMKCSTMNISQRERFAGKSKFLFKQKVRLAINAIFDFSEIPLKITIRFGLFVTLFSLVALLTIVILRLFFIEYHIGWPSIICLIILGFGLQTFFMGICAKYIGNIYKESKMRPLFSIKQLYNFES